MSGYLIIRLKGLGDIVHLIPVLRMIRKQEPEIPIGLVCQTPFGEIIPKELNIDIFHLRPHAGIVDTFKLLKSIRRKKYSRLFDLFGNPRTAVLSFLSGIKERYGFDYRIRRMAFTETFTPKDPNKHLMYLFGEFFEAFGIKGELQIPNLLPEQKLTDKAVNIFEQNGVKSGLLGINPHTTYPSKAWPEEYFVEFIKLWYEKTGEKTLVTWGPGEEEAAARIVKQVGEDKAFIHPKVNIPEFAAILANLDLFLTADTGPMNISWAVNTPTVALFGPTTRNAVAPRGDEHLTLFREDVECLQCHQEQCSHKSCMVKMTPEWVFERVWKKYEEWVTGE